MSQPPPAPPAKKPTQLARGFSCKSCGAPVKLLTGGVALSAACGHCGTAVDVNDPNLRVLAQWQSKMGKLKPVIPIGARGMLKDISWQCIGCMGRRERQSGWAWEEYLLFNPYHGFRWLVHDHGHWSYVTMIKDRPNIVGASGPTFRGRSYRRWAQATVVVTHVIGEFYWLLEKDETVSATDYISPPYMLSQEVYPGGSELIYSLGEYTGPEVIRQAFNLPGMPLRQDIGAIQPNPWKERSSVAWKWALLALVVLLAEQFGVLTMSSHTPALKESFAYVDQQPDKRIFASQPFTLGGLTRGVSVKTESMISGGSLDLRLRLVNEDTQRSYPLGQTIARFSGWSDERSTAVSTLSSVPDGRYRLVVEPSNFVSIDPENDTSGFVAALASASPPPQVVPPIPLTFEVARVSDWSPFKFCAFLMLVPAVIVGALSLFYEGRRWQNSDEGGSSATSGNGGSGGFLAFSKDDD